jgi:V8-like Glu-specific endopeptidase
LPSVSPVYPTAGSPLQAVVELQVTYPDHQTAVGSGAMIDSSHVLTAAHILYSAKDGGYATSIEVIPAVNGNDAPFGVAFGTMERVDPSWLSFNQSNPGATSPSVEDIGLVTLNRAIGDSTGWFGIGYNNNNASFSGAMFQTAGYPAIPGQTGPQMFAGSGKALGTVSNDCIGFAQSSLPALPGQSGSPIYQTSGKGAPVIYGVLTGANGFSPSSEVYTARITQSVYNELQNWEKADKTPPTFANLGSSSQVTLQHPAGAAPQVKGAASLSAPAIQALDVGWATNPDIYSMYGNPYYGSWGSYNPGSYSYQDPYLYTGPQFVQGYGLNYGTQSIYSSDPYTQFGADFFSYGASPYSQSLYPDMEWPAEVYY